MLIDGWMDKQNVVYTYNGILVSLKFKKGDSDTCYNMDEPWGHYAKWNVSHKKTNTVWFHLYEVPRVVKFIETESRMLAARLGGGETRVVS